MTAKRDAARNQSPMHIQQNSYLHCVHDMWLQPWFFSMRVLHFGQRFVLARIQLAVSDSFWHFSNQRATSSQLAGWCACSPHLKQNQLPQPAGAQRTLRTPAPPSTTLVQPGLGHQHISRTKLTNDCTRKRSYLAKDGAAVSASNAAGGTSVVHLCSGHFVKMTVGPSSTLALR